MIQYGLEAKQKMLIGINKLAKAVVITLGPGGRNVGLQKSIGNPFITKDGVSVAKEIELEDPWENIGCRILREAASKTSEDVGDGTTTSVLLARYMAVQGMKKIEAHFSPVQYKRGMDKALRLLCAEIDFLATPVKDPKAIESVAKISSNGDNAIAKIIADAVSMVGKDGVVNIEEGRGIETVIETTDGMRIDRGWINSSFCFDEKKNESVLKNPYVLVTDHVVAALRGMLPLLEELMKSNASLLIIAPDFQGESIPTFYMNREKLQTQLVKAPSFGASQKAILEDIAILTGATFISKDLGMTLNTIKLSDLGQLGSAKVTAKDTILVDGVGSPEKIEERANQIKYEIERSGSEYDKDKLRERLSRLMGGICVIRVGAVSEINMKETKARMEDALYATRASIEGGIVVGGGVAYLRAAQGVRLESIEETEKFGVDEKAGFDMVLDACEEPVRQIVSNTGLVGDVYVEKVKEGSDDFGFDASDRRLKKLFDAGIVDPAKVVKSALINSVSVASTLLTTEAVIHNSKKEDRA